MGDKIKKITNTKQFHIIMVSLLVSIILIVSGVIILKYNVEGDTNLPFELSKISVISRVEGIDNLDDAENKWNIKVNQNNDIYLHIKKNDQYKDTEAIESIVLNNFAVEQSPEKGELKIYKPDAKVESTMFSNVPDNETNEIKYQGDINSSIKDLKISNQGGLVIFRYSIDNIGTYISNDDEQINHDDLLKKLEIKNSQLKFKVSFDIYINLESGKSYKSNIKLELPIDDVVNNGVQSMEDSELKDVLFKRI